MKKLLFILPIALLVSCGGSSTEKGIVGKWEVTGVEIGREDGQPIPESAAGDVHVMEEKLKGAVYEFKEGEKYTYTDKEGKSKSGEYKLVEVEGKYTVALFEDGAGATKLELKEFDDTHFTTESTGDGISLKMTYTKK